MADDPSASGGSSRVERSVITDPPGADGPPPGQAALHRKPWARVLALVVAIFALFSFPIGTIIAIYSFWVLTREESQQLLSGAM